MATAVNGRHTHTHKIYLHPIRYNIRMLRSIIEFVQFFSLCVFVSKTHVNTCFIFLFCFLLLWFGGFMDGGKKSSHYTKQTDNFDIFILLICFVIIFIWRKIEVSYFVFRTADFFFFHSNIISFIYLFVNHRWFSSILSDTHHYLLVRKMRVRV